MRWLLSIFKIRREPLPLRELPVLLLKAVIFGLIYGPVFLITVTAIFDFSSLRDVLHPGIILGWAPLEGVVWALSFYIACGLGNAWLRPHLRGYPPSIIGTVHIVYNVIASSLAFAVAGGIVTHLPGPVKFEIPYFWRIVLLDGIIGGILALVIGAFVKLRVQVEQTQAALHEREIQQSVLEKETARAQSLALQSQINPHFFFNTLNTISALIEIDPAAAQRMIGRLSDMFRYTLGCTHSGPVALEQEVQFVRDYLAIEQARFQRRLRVELPASGLTDIRVPGLVSGWMVVPCPSRWNGTGGARESAFGTRPMAMGTSRKRIFSAPATLSKTCARGYGSSRAIRIHCGSGATRHGWNSASIWRRRNHDPDTFGG
jgi:hypothetical protein